MENSLEGSWFNYSEKCSCKDENINCHSTKWGGEQFLEREPVYVLLPLFTSTFSVLQQVVKPCAADMGRRYLYC